MDWKATLEWLHDNPTANVGGWDGQADLADMPLPDGIEPTPGKEWECTAIDGIPVTRIGDTGYTVAFPPNSDPLVIDTDGNEV